MSLVGEGKAAEAGHPGRASGAWLAPLHSGQARVLRKHPHCL